MLSAFENYISSKELFKRQDVLLLAFSGGVDSVVLAHLLKSAGYQFSLAHCNFGLRGTESDGDESFCRAFASEMGIDIEIKYFDTEKYASDNKLSTQVAARELRYAWFNEIIASSAGKIKYLLTAHHADDNIETVLMNFFKGTGIAGLKGILPKQSNIIRPLLFAEKAEILQYAADNSLNWREDSSNSSDKYTRNFFRNQIIPVVEKAFPGVKENLTSNIERFADINELYRLHIEKLKKGLLFREQKEWKVPVLKLQKTPAPKTVLWEIIKDFGFTAAQVPEVMKLLKSMSGKFITSTTHRILRNRAWLIISPIGENTESILVLEKPGDNVALPIGIVSSQMVSTAGPISQDENVAQLAARDIHFPLLVRKWKQGDYFYPLGMKKKKKLSRFFIDKKMSLTQKENIWVVESNKKILWIVGQRIDERFKVDVNSPVNILLLRLHISGLKG